jgi:hypothetical protein
MTMSVGKDRGHSSTTRRARTRLACTIAVPLAVLLGLGLPHAQEKPLPDLESLLKGLRKTLHSDRVLLSQYTYAQKNTEKRLDKSGRVSKTEVEVFEMYPSLEEDLSYARLISKDGKPVDPEELEKKDREQQKKVLDRVRKTERATADEKAKRLAKVAQERRKEDESIDEAFALYSISMTGRDVVDGHDAIVLEFRARPDFKVKTDAGKILKKLKGRAWIDERDRELLRIDVDLVDSISFGLGLLAKLSPGAHATFQRRLVNNEIWLPAEARFTGSARLLLLKGLRVDGTVEYSDYKKFSVGTETSFSLPKP